jgi:hypothetical protein
MAKPTWVKVKEDGIVIGEIMFLPGWSTCIAYLEPPIIIGKQKVHKEFKSQEAAEAWIRRHAESLDKT